MTFAGPTDVISQESLLIEESRLYDVGAEHSFLACIFQSNELIYEAERLVSPDWLYHSDHHYIYQIMLGHKTACEQFGWDLSFDHQYMLHVARQFGKACEDRFLNRTDGMEKVRQLERKATNIDIARFGIYVELIRDRSVRVQAYRQARQVQVQAMDFENNHSANAIAIDAESRFTDLVYASDQGDESRISHLAEGADWTLAKARLNAQYPHEGLFTVRCPFPKLNEVLGGGFHRKGLSLLCARPKTGKTTFLLNLCIEMANRGIPALFIDNEMTREEVFTRELSRVTNFKEQDIIAGKFLRDNDRDDNGPSISEDTIMEKLKELRGKPLFYVNVAGRPGTAVLSVMRQFRQRYVGDKDYTDHTTGKTYTFARPALVVYDWLKLPDASQLGANRAEHQMLGFTASKIKDAATVLDLAVVAGAQQNREAVGVSDDDFETMLERFVAGSDKLTQFCTSLMALRNVSDAEGQAQLDYDWHEQFEKLERVSPDEQYGQARLLFGNTSREIEAVKANTTTQLGDLEPRDQQGNIAPRRPAWEPAAGRTNREPGAASLRYNQILVIGVNRKGPSCREGIPFYHDFGRFKYLEHSNPYTKAFREAYRHGRKKQDKKAAKKDETRYQASVQDGLAEHDVSPPDIGQE